MSERVSREVVTIDRVDDDEAGNVYDVRRARDGTWIGYIWHQHGGPRGAGWYAERYTEKPSHEIEEGEEISWKWGPMDTLEDAVRWMEKRA